MPKLKEIIGDAAYTALPEDIRKQHGEVDFVDGSTHVDKKDLETANATIKQYVKDIKKRDDDLLAVQDKVKDNEDLTKEIEGLKIANKKDSEDYAANLAKINFDSKLEKKLSEYNPQNVAILKKAVDSTKLSLDGDNFIGLEEQIKALNETDKYLFKEAVSTENQAKGTGILGGGNTPGDDKGSDSIGALLAKSKTENKNVEAQNKFFA